MTCGPGKKGKPGDASGFTLCREKKERRWKVKQSQPLRAVKWKTAIKKAMGKTRERIRTVSLTDVQKLSNSEKSEFR